MFPEARASERATFLPFPLLPPPLPSLDAAAVTAGGHGMVWYGMVAPFSANCSAEPAMFASLSLCLSTLLRVVGTKGKINWLDLEAD